MVTFNKHTTLVVWIFFLSKLNGRQRDKFFQSHGTLRVNSHKEISKLNLNSNNLSPGKSVNIDRHLLVALYLI